jgi:hypothetical protein
MVNMCYNERQTNARAVLLTPASVAELVAVLRSHESDMPKPTTTSSQAEIPSELLCSKCGFTKPMACFNKRAALQRGYSHWCKACMSAYMNIRSRSPKEAEEKRRKYVVNRERQRLIAREHYRRNREATLRQIADKRQRDKLAAFAAYGGAVCNCCGESTVEFLSIDHISNDGAAHRKSGGKHIYAWLRRYKYPEGFQVLCFNCNRGRFVNGGICPHQTIVQAITAKPAS